MNYLALLGNVNESILNIALGDGFSIEKMPLFDFAKCCEEEFGIEDVWMKIDFNWGCVHDDTYRPEFVYVITKTLEHDPTSSDSEDFKNRKNLLHLELAYRDKISKYLDDKITKLRLLKEGSIRISIECYFELDEDGSRDFLGGSESALSCEHRLYELNDYKIDIANRFLAGPPLEKVPKYLNFALRNFEQSYQVAHKEFEYLSLMIALEALLNPDDKIELKMRVSRGCAVLLGKTVEESRHVFKQVKGLYDKRSSLVHTGDGSKITNSDVLCLKDLIRRSLKKALDLNLPSQELSTLLMESGFGSLR
jgi:hypothetical protein